MGVSTQSTWEFKILFSQRMFKTVLVIMLMLSVASAFPTGGEIAKQLLGSGAEVTKCVLKKKASTAIQNAWTGFKSLFGQRRRLGALDMIKGAAGKAGNAIKDKAGAAGNAIKGKAAEAARKVATPLCQKAANALASRAAENVLKTHFDNDGKACLKEVVDAKCVAKVNALIK